MRVVAVGDVQPHRERPEELFQLVADDLAWGDLRACQLEATLSNRGTVRTDVRNPAHRVPPTNIRALTEAGFDVVTFAGNNNLDYGLEAFQDTIELCREHGIDVVGAGDNIFQATSPVIKTVGNRRVAFVNFCSILRDGYAATTSRAGISPLVVATFYEPLENIYEQPGTPARTVTVVDADDLERVLATISQAARDADIVIASFHWGVHFTHDLAMYQPDVAYAAIDAGASVVLGTHPHCLQAVDVYKGKFILYSLGNFAFEQVSPHAHKGVAQYLSFYGLPVDTDLPQHPHPVHCRKTMIAKIAFAESGDATLTLVPAYFNSEARPQPLVEGDREYEPVVSLIEELCAEIGTRTERTDSGISISSEKFDEIDTRRWVRSRKSSYPWLQRLAAESAPTAAVELA